MAAEVRRREALQAASRWPKWMRPQRRAQCTKLGSSAGRMCVGGASRRQGSGARSRCGTVLACSRRRVAPRTAGRHQRLCQSRHPLCNTYRQIHPPIRAQRVNRRLQRQHEPNCQHNATAALLPIPLSLKVGFHELLRPQLKISDGRVFGWMHVIDACRHSLHHGVNIRGVEERNRDPAS